MCLSLNSSNLLVFVSPKDKRGAPDHRGSPNCMHGPCNPEKIGLRGRILLNSEDRPVQDPGNGSGRVRGIISVLSVRVFCTFRGEILIAVK